MVRNRGPDLLVSVPQAEFRSSLGTTVPEIIKLLKDSDGNVRQAAAENLSQLSEQGKTVKLPNVTFLMTIIAEFRPFIGPAIPEVVELLKHNGSEVCKTVANTLSQLSEQGKIAKGPVIPEIVKLLKNTNWEVCLAGVDALSQLSEHGKMDNVSDVASLMTIIAEFRPLIASAIPEIVTLIKHTRWEVRETAANTLLQLSEQGKTVKLPNGTLLMTIIAEFRPLIGSAIPEIVELLEHNRSEVRQTAANNLLQLSKQGKTAKLFDVALLMTIK
jgi:HEAT repeat protein